MTCWPPRSYFNPRSSCEERPRDRFAGRSRRDFKPPPESPPPRACGARAALKADNFNPRSSCEERRASLSDGRHADAISIHAPHARSDTPKDVPCGRFDVISIHAPHARSDQLYTQKIRYLAIFQSTLLMRGATVRWSCLRAGKTIFQSTLLMRGATNSHSSGRIMSRYFNPRSSCEERLLHAPSLPFMHHFNPRSSCEERRDFG